MTPKEIYEQLDNIEYGWVDNEGAKHCKLQPVLFSEIYMLQNPEELIKSKLGVCWDQVELERFYFSKTNLKFHSYDILYINKNQMPNHTFFVYEENNKYYWFEHAFEKYRGIHEFNDLKSLLLKVKEAFVTTEIKDKYAYEYNEKFLNIFEYDEPKEHLNCTDFYNHFMNGKNVTSIIKE